MGIVPRFTDANIAKELRRGLVTIESGIIKILQFAGEKFVKDAREGTNIAASAFPKGNYQTHTANLRSSTGYFVLNNGVIIHNSLDGTPEGVAAALSVLATIPKGGYQLIGVAGMDYASNVESKGYNVITSQRDICLVDISRNLEKFKDKLNQKGVSVNFDINDLVLTATR